MPAFLNGPQEPPSTLDSAGDHAGTWSQTIDDTGGPPQTPTRSCVTCTAPPETDSPELLENSARTFLVNEPAFTPNPPVRDRTRMDPLVKEEREILKEKLKPFHELPKKSTFASSLYHNQASDERIDKFLAETEVFDSANERWALPESHSKLEEEMMYTPLIRLLTEIFKCFWSDNAARRQAIDTHATQLYHQEPVPTLNHSSPDISILADGPSFQLPPRATNTGVGYSNIATCFEVKVTNKKRVFADELLQLAGYIRQIFIHQPNRRFVRALIITERDFRLYHFDRSGVQYSQPIDIHEKKGRRTFVRLVLGLSSLQESDIGLDESIKWEIEDGRKVKGTLRARQQNNVEVVYNLVDVEPTVLCYEIRGRGVTCWRVVDPASGEELFVRDIWRSADRPSEQFFLKIAKGVPGVVQAISFELNRGETRKCRGFGNSTKLKFHNRIAVRVVMDSHGKSIKHFKSPKELLCALRDAIAGHRGLFKKQALHRDITLDNIMLGRSNASNGNRGVLIGLDLAKQPDSKASADWNELTGIYQSIAVLKRSRGRRYPLAQSYIDDLESFVYVLTHVILDYDHTGAAHTPNEMLRGWDLHPKDQAHNKEAYLSRRYIDVEYEAHKRWPPSCIELLNSYKALLRDIHERKDMLTNLKPSVRLGDLEELTLLVSRHYQAVLDLFDEAIRKIESGNDHIPPDSPDSEIADDADVDIVAGDASSSSLAQVHEASLSSPLAGQDHDVSGDQESARSLLSLKRPREDDSEDEPEAKRDSSPFTGFAETPSRKTRYYNVSILRKHRPSLKRSPKANRQSSRRVERKSLDEIPEEDEAGESSDELDTL